MTTIDNGGVHINAVVSYRDSESGREALITINVWPLPVNGALANEIFTVARDAVNACLTKHGIVSGALSQIPPAGTRH